MTRLPPLSGKVSVRPRVTADLRPADAKAIVDELIAGDGLLVDALTEIRWMHDLAYGTGSSGGRRGMPRPPESDQDGAPTPEAWGQVPGDLATLAASNGHYRSAYRQMTRHLREARASVLKIITTAEKVIGEATTNGSPLPDMRADKLGKVEYEQLARIQARRRSRGEL